MSMDLPPLGTYIPADIPWAEVQARVAAAADYWLCTVRPDGRPHAVPIWGAWLDEAFYFYTEPQTQKVKNLTAQPEVVVHLESAADVVIVEGPVQEVAAGGAAWHACARALFAKYKDPQTGTGLQLAAAPRAAVVFRLRPRHVRAWAHGNSFAQSHWHFADEEAPL